jgi:hypothetical protein
MDESLNRTIDINGQVITLKYSSAVYIPFIKDYSVECVEVYIDSNYMGNFTDIDSLNDYINDLF